MPAETARGGRELKGRSAWALAGSPFPGSRQLAILRALVPSPSRPLVITILLGAHLLWVVGRVPHSVVAKRLRAIESFASRGDCAHYLDGEQLSGADEIAWIRANCGDDAIVLFDGERKGALEFAPCLLFPRLLVAASAVAQDATNHGGRPIAQGERDGRRGRIVLVGHGRRLGIELR